MTKNPKRQELPQAESSRPPQKLWAGLWIVATPIGNLQDLTARAKVALETADAVVCEDTRKSAQLFSALGIHPGKIMQWDQNSAASKWAPIFSFLREGKSVAYLTDAGTPGISDPGSLLVQKAREAGIRITPIPGVSAVTTLLSVAGFDENAFAFQGFFPRKDSEKKNLVKTCMNSQGISLYVWFESPKRILETFEAISEASVENSGDEKIHAVVAKELTKLHEKIYFGSLKEVLNWVRREVTEQGAIGEWCFALDFLRTRVIHTEASLQDAHWKKTLSCLIDCGISVSHATKKICQEFGVKKNQVYDEALRLEQQKK